MKEKITRGSWRDEGIKLKRENN